MFSARTSAPASMCTTPPASHYYLKHPDKPGVRVTLPWHNRDLKRGTLSSVIEQAGYTTEEFVKLL
jgi:HicA toxin of bacterial toxin-antitoxin,